MGTNHRGGWTAALALAVSLAAPLATGVASAQPGPPRDRGVEQPRPQTDRDGSDRGWRGLDPAPYDRGFEDGLRQGENDARRNQRFDPQRHSAYRTADRGYDWRFGERGTYVDVYRRGFEDGYRRGYRPVQGRFGRPPGRGPDGTFGRGRVIREPAVARGYEDGYKRGLEDVRDGDRYDPIGSRDYRDGDNGYSRSYNGTRDAYRTNYRAGFRQGYEEGYREGFRYGRD
jgi:hypothetical protein